MGVIVATGAVAVTPPLIFRTLIDQALPQKNMAMVVWLFLAAVGLALTTTGLNLAGRWFASVIGEGLIFDLRTPLYGHVQRMPVAFFTRTQTGSLMSRLSTHC